MSVDAFRPRIVDTQVHLWHNEDADHPWTNSWRAYAHRGGLSPTAGELVAAMDQAGVDLALLVSPTFGGDSANNRAVLDAVSQASGRFLGVGRVDLVEDTPEAVIAWMSKPGAAGIRLTFGRGASRGWLVDGTADWFWPVAQEHQIPVFVSCPGHVSDLIAVLRKFPFLRIALDHAGIPPGNRPRPAEVLVNEACWLADFPNVAVKASAFPAFAPEPYPYETAQRWTRALVEAFGAERVFWGTDLTRGLPCTWKQAVDHLATPSGLRAEDLALVRGEAVLAWLAASGKPTPLSPSSNTGESA